MSNKRELYQVIRYFPGAICWIADQLTQATNHFLCMLLLVSDFYQEFNCDPKMFKLTTIDSILIRAPITSSSKTHLWKPTALPRGFQILHSPNEQIKSNRMRHFKSFYVDFSHLKFDFKHRIFHSMVIYGAKLCKRDRKLTIRLAANIGDYLKRLSFLLE